MTSILIHFNSSIMDIHPSRIVLGLITGILPYVLSTHAIESLISNSIHQPLSGIEQTELNPVDGRF